MTDEQRTKAIAYFKNRSQTALMPGANAMFRLALEALEQLKIDPVKHGHWIEYTGADKGFHYCSECEGQAFNYDEGSQCVEVLSNYCPNCGARMDGEV